MSEAASTLGHMKNTHDDLGEFIVRAKAATYVGGGGSAAATRPGSHDVVHAEPGWEYRDSYFGGTDFLGQEIVWRVEEAQRTPGWVMNYYGRGLRDDLFDAATGGRIIQHALSAMYQEGRFLGGFHWSDEDGHEYEDASTGDHRSFTGRERILRGDVEVYALDYHGGIVRP